MVLSDSGTSNITYIGEIGASCHTGWLPQSLLRTIPTDPGWNPSGYENNSIQCIFNANIHNYPGQVWNRHPGRKNIVPKNDLSGFPDGSYPDRTYPDQCER